MREMNYLGATARMREHRNLLRTMEQMERLMICGNYDNRDISEFLTAWLHRHVAAFDKPLGSSMRARKGRPGREDMANTVGR